MARKAIFNILSHRATLSLCGPENWCLGFRARSWRPPRTTSLDANDEIRVLEGITYQNQTTPLVSLSQSLLFVLLIAKGTFRHMQA